MQPPEPALDDRPIATRGDERPPDVSVVIPTYRGAASLPALTGQLRELFTHRGVTYEIIVVNDASPDETWSVIQSLAHDDDHIVGIDLLNNHGQPTATMCGLAAANGQLVATMDDDLEHRPDQLGILLDTLTSRTDLDAVVATWPVERSVARDLGTRIHALADRIAWGTPKGFRHTAFRLMRRPVCDAIVDHRTRTPVVGPILTQVSGRVENVEVEHGTRSHGASGFTVREGVQRVVRNFTAGSTAPLKLISALGLILAFAAFAFGGILLLRWVFGAQSPAGWLSVMLATVFVGGTNLLAFGILGSYIDLIVREVRRPPRWAVRGTTQRLDTESSDGGRNREAS
jgi:dolichol-phosphate mannosyltransferase/undecaprenyl-phosphate 4-deoxy-4-formamido-L-arabinose transferase